MGRELSEEEKAEIRTWITAQSDFVILDAVKHFEERFGFPITETCILMRIVEVELSKKRN